MVTILDIGAHNGESIEEFLNWPFDTIHSYEPMPAQYANCVTQYGTNPRVHLHNVGVSDHNGTMTVYGADIHGEASIFATKTDIDPRTETICTFIDVADIFAGIDPAETLYVKVNCEGSEVAILERLLETGLLPRIHALRVEFDISRVPGNENTADSLLIRLADAGFDRLTIGSNARITPHGLVDDVVQVGVHADRMRAWLESVWQS